MMVSYAQDVEDVMLQRAFPRDYRGFYIDAGASDPVQFSVTKHFYDRGWRGINIEPVSSVWGRLRDQRPRDVNLNAGLSDREGRFTFYEVASETTWSTLSAEAAEAFRGRGLEVRPHEIPVTTLARVCEQHADAPIDVLKIDVEYHELRSSPAATGCAGGRGSCWWKTTAPSVGAPPPGARIPPRGYDRDQPVLHPRRGPVAPAAIPRPLGPQDSFILAGELDDQRVVWGEALAPNALRTALRLHHWRPATRGWRPWGRP